MLSGAEERLTNDAKLEGGGEGAVCIPSADENLTNDAKLESGGEGAVCIPRRRRKFDERRETGEWGRGRGMHSERRRKFDERRETGEWGRGRGVQSGRRRKLDERRECGGWERGCGVQSGRRRKLDERREFGGCQRGAECIPNSDENLTNDANSEMGGSQEQVIQEVVKAPVETENRIGAISACRERSDDRFGKPAAGISTGSAQALGSPKGRRSSEEAVFSRGRC